MKRSWGRRFSQSSAPRVSRASRGLRCYLALGALPRQHALPPGKGRNMGRGRTCQREEHRMRGLGESPCVRSGTVD